jgi:hypothetical protein
MSSLHRWNTKKFQYQSKRGRWITGYTVSCPECGKRSRLFWYAGGYKFSCRHCGSDGGGDCYPPLIEPASETQLS